MKWKMKLTRLQEYSGERIPKGYGVAYREYNSFTIVLMPIPLNIIVGLVRKLYYQMMLGVYPTFADRLVARGILIEKQNKVNMAADLFVEKFPVKLYATIFKAQYDGTMAALNLAAKNAEELIKIELLVGQPTAEAVNRELKKLRDEVVKLRKLLHIETQ